MGVHRHATTPSWGDYDNDGRPDLYVAGFLVTETHYPDHLFHNTPFGPFVDVLPELVKAHDASHGVQWVDFDGDGALDLALANNDAKGGHFLFRNLLPPSVARRSLAVDVVDERGRHTKAGAEVRVYAAGTRRLISSGLVDTGGGYCSQNVMRLYRRLQFGNLIDLSVLDTRQWRSDQACGDGSHTDCAEALDPVRTMMGAEQEKWLFDNLASAKSKWTVIGQQVYSFAFDRAKADPQGRFSMDKWDGYVAARQRLYKRLIETKAPNPIVLSGDVHQHYGADLKLDFTNPRSVAIGVEFTNSAISTTGDGSDVSSTWEATRGDNPHVRYHSNRRGYIACTATPAQMRAEFKILDKVTVADLPVRVGGALVVEAGRPGSSTD